MLLRRAPITNSSHHPGNDAGRAGNEVLGAIEFVNLVLLSDS